MYMNQQWSERTLLDEIQALIARIDKIGDPKDRQGKHTVSYLKQMVKAKREKLAALRYESHH
ncbi:MAG: hypothetical protein AAF458_21210 [Pseudomonadota bacterium]